MASFQRDQVATLTRRLAEPPDFIIALFGPRQTGKTTIVRQALRLIEQRSLRSGTKTCTAAPMRRSTRNPVGTRSSN